jgi:hypothetical protein
LFLFLACTSQAMVSYPKIRTLAMAEMDFTWTAAGVIKQSLFATRVPSRGQIITLFNILEILITILFAGYVFWNIMYWSRRHRRRKLGSVSLATAGR